MTDRFAQLQTSIEFVQAQVGILAQRLDQVEADNAELRRRLTERDIAIDELRKVPK